jgi:hypothetical protein
MDLIELFCLGNLIAILEVVKSLLKERIPKRCVSFIVDFAYLKGA